MILFMSKRDLELFLFDVLIAIIKIEETVTHFTNADELKHNYRSWDSVIREFEIVGEATKHLIENSILDKGKQQVVDFRNLLVHHYFGIDEDAVWMVIQKDLLDFKKVIYGNIEVLDNELKEELIEDFLEENSYLDFVVKELVGLRIANDR